MINISVKEVAQITAGRLSSKDEEAVVNGISIDSRTIEPGQFFVAIRGSNFDGHNFIRDAAAKGATGLITEHPVEPGCYERIDHVIVVEDSREAIGLIAAEIRRRVDIPVICITGTNGKTTLKDILSHVLSSRYKVLKSRKSYNNIIGLGLTLFDMDSSYDIAVLELGSSCPGEISKLAGIARPLMAVITNIGNGHLESFTDRESVFTEKISLLDSLPCTGMAFLNGDDPLLAGMAARDDVSPIGYRAGSTLRKFYGMSPGCDFLITGLLKRERGYDFLLNGNRFFVPLEGAHNVYNAAAAIAVAGYFDMSFADIQAALKGVSPPKMRLEEVSIDGLMFINDAYNANPDSFECALKVLQDRAAEGKKGVVAGDMLELGARSEEFHRMIGKSIADKGIDFLIALGGKARHIAEGALESGMKKGRALCAKSHNEAAEMIRRMADPETVVLLKGSRATKMEEVLKCFIRSCTP